MADKVNPNPSNVAAGETAVLANIAASAWLLMSLLAKIEYLYNEERKKRANFDRALKLEKRIREVKMAIQALEDDLKAEKAAGAA